MTVPMRFRQYIQVKAGEECDPETVCPAAGYILPEECEPPDPEIFCPANGYIPDEPASSSWIHVLTIYTNSPNTTTFDPSIGSSSIDDNDFAWLIGGNEYNVRSLSLTLDGTLQEVQLWVKDTVAEITSIDFRSDHIVGVIDLTHPIFNLINTIRTQGNSELTGIYFPQDQDAKLNDLWLYDCNLHGVLDLSMFSRLDTSMIISVYNNPNLHGIVFAPSIIEGTVQYLNLDRCDLLGTLDLSMFDTFRNDSSGFNINLYNNSHLTGVKFASTITGRLKNLWLYNCDLRYDVDLSMFKDLTTYASIQLYNNPNMKTLTFASTLTTVGSVSTLQLRDCDNLLSLDISMFTSFTDSGNFSVARNIAMTSLILPTMTAGALRYFYINDSGLSGTINLSGITTGSSGSMWYLNGCDDLTVYNLGSGKSGSFNYLRGYGTSPFFDLTAWIAPIITSTTEVKFSNCGWSQAQVDQFLADADSLTAGLGYKCKIYLTGNSIPTAAGLISKANLEAKGMYIYVDA